eukprot:CAMPEP_0197826088 /NCGR_PEP_ID=MMETSP1437-20131217/3081_1 /TAXON_ID=49252 ORGANISM="Eucampia antarctica, Strain CCMP1452" /NCGR_SAMPLE_ID=MMETSP1437 /ASSEMBLY_ACC=CAM_ASM_001096 /LENGTH=169 /DNA_ID=CAMNT_0043426355 /DNA_START=77 /DNA_END=583 /DNA_ORIENTATION=-
MAKGLRAKCRRKARRDFRNTIGKDADDKMMDLIQSKLSENIEKGGMNSLERLSNMLDASSTTTSASTSSAFISSSSKSMMQTEDGDDDDDDDTPNNNNNNDMMMDSNATRSSGLGKSESKIPIKRSSLSLRKKRKIQLIPNAPGQSGARMAKKIIGKAKRRGQIKKGNW